MAYFQICPNFNFGQFYKTEKLDFHQIQKPQFIYINNQTFTIVLFF